MKQIIVAEAGWVFIGEVQETDEPGARLKNAAVIRNWGTTAGLGQIALSGPTKNTVLDPCGEVYIGRPIARINCEV